ncbi:MAG: threonine/serine dehydratase [Anaerolineae bacterium]|nr:threonine/serine dehydratase [Anaerolineae bacterium]
MYDIPTLRDVYRARRQIRPYLNPSPLRHSIGLSELLGAEVWVKHDGMLPTSAFKVRGGVNLVSQLSPSERQAGLICASTGNHGQSIAYAGRLFGVPVIVGAPAGANPLKVAAMRALGADVLLQGRDFDDARENVERLAQQHGYRYVHSGNEPLLIAGVGTHTLEIVEELPDVDVVIVPIGGGSGAAGACIVAKSVDPRIQVIGVQSSAAPAAHLSWQAGEPRTAPMQTFAEGLATRTSFALPQQILRHHLDDFLLVSDDALREAIVLMLEHTRSLTEAAGASPLAGALTIRDRLAGKRVALIQSGANITLAGLREALGV